MYHLVIQQFVHSLRALDTILGKAEQSAQTRNFDANLYLGQRLFVDMLPFASQVRIATDMAKATAASLSGKAAPRFADDETTLEQLRTRLRQTVEYLAGLSEQDFAATDATTIVNIPFPKGKALRANEYVFGRQIPNFFFHVTTAYNLLRAAGVEIGKLDFIGPLNVLDA